MEYEEIQQGEIILCEPGMKFQPIGISALPGWCVSKTKHFHEADTEEFRKDALARIYTAIDRGGGRWLTKDDEAKIKLMDRLADQLAELLVGGKPESFEVFT